MKLSIITINRNNAAGLRKTIESVVSQTFTNFEYIVIDGASTDDSVDVIKKYAERITYWVSEPDTGIYNAMNKGILKASGEYLLFLNSGDWLCNDVLDKILKNDRYSDIIYGNVFVFNEEKIWEMKYPFVLSLSFFYFGGNICHQGTFIKREFLIEIGGYDECFRICADYDSYIKAILKGKSFEHVDLFIAFYNHEGISSTERILLDNEFKYSIKKNVSDSIQNDYNELNKIRNEIEYFKNSKYFKLRNKNNIYRKTITLFLLILSTIDKIISKIWKLSH